MDDVPAAAIQDTEQVVEGAAQVDVGKIHMPVLMQLQRLHDSGALEGILEGILAVPRGGAILTSDAQLLYLKLLKRWRTFSYEASL